MSQNLLSLSFSADALAAIDGALSTLESQLAPLISLGVDERRTLTKMGDKSEAFCRQTLNVLAQSPAILPPTFNLAEAQSDLANIDTLRPRVARLQRLMDRAEDSTTALGSDVMAASLEGYALLKVYGQSHGLEKLRQGIGSRFSRRAAAPTHATPPVPA